MADSIIRKVDLDSKKDVRVEVSEYKGKTNIGVRLWYTTDEGEAARTKKGVNVPLDDAPILIETLIAVYNEATGMSLSLQES